VIPQAGLYALAQYLDGLLIVRLDVGGGHPNFFSTPTESLPTDRPMAMAMAMAIEIAKNRDCD
jgi:hypothetical protein